jgi:NAD(P)-dependent dehydrogenase (short-subunit alcohol dehydrogenase family)
MSIEGKKRVWFVTGASRGIGAAIASAALAAGDEVAATGRNPVAIADRFGDHPSLFAAKLDVTDAELAHKAVEAAIKRFGSIDVLVNNAGYGLLGAVEEATMTEVRQIFETNVFGLLNVTRAALPHFRSRRSGHIINISSVGGYRSGPGFGIYCSTKFAVEGISEALHGELKPLGVRVTVVEPGYIRTDFLDASSLVISPTRIAEYDATAGETRRNAAAYSHAQPGDPDKLAKAVIALVQAPAPPLRLPLGADAVNAIENKTASVGQELEAWRELATSIAF